jgi:hypothetical protein
LTRHTPSQRSHIVIFSARRTFTLTAKRSSTRPQSLASGVLCQISTQTSGSSIGRVRHHRSRHPRHRLVKLWRDAQLARQKQHQGVGAMFGKTDPL